VSGTKPGKGRRLGWSAAIAVVTVTLDDLAQRRQVLAGAIAGGSGSHVLAAEITGGVLFAVVLTVAFYVISSGITVTRRGGPR
jgi:hypothetical protein